MVCTYHWTKTSPNYYTIYCAQNWKFSNTWQRGKITCWMIFNAYLQNIINVEKKNTCVYPRSEFLAHLNRRFKWAILIAFCPWSVRLSVCPLTFHIFDFFSRTAGPNSTKLGTHHPWVKGLQVCSNEGPGLLQRGDNHENAKIGWCHLKIFFSRTTGPGWARKAEI